MDASGKDLRQYLRGSYGELHALAVALLRRGGRGSARATSLAHETWLRLAGRRATCTSREHFLAIASRALRDALVDRARRRTALKRGGGQNVVHLDERLLGEEPREDLVALDDALGRLARLDPRKARVVEMRFFGGLAVDEVARVLGVSPATVKRDWAVARAWLFREVRR